MGIKVRAGATQASVLNLHGVYLNPAIWATLNKKLDCQSVCREWA